MHGKTRERTGLWLALIAASGVAVTAPLMVISPAIASQAGHVSHGTPPMSCGAQLRVIRNVSKQAGIYAGSQHTSTHNQGTPKTWARELRQAGLSFLARSAAAIDDSVTDRDFVVAMTASAASIEAGHCTGKVRPTVPRWFHWRMATYRVHDFGYTFPCVRVWGQDNQTPVNTGEFGWVCEDGSVLNGVNP